MQHQIQNAPRSALLHLSLLPEELVFAAPGALVGRGAAVGRVRSLSPSAIACYQAKNSPGRLSLAPAGPGEIACVSVEEGQTWYVSSEAWLASAPGLMTDAGWGGARGFFSSPGVGLFKVEGQGALFVSALGALREVAVQGSFLVDTDYVVAYPGSLHYEIKKAPGKKLLCRFLGKGRLLLQTRSFGALARWSEPYRRVLMRS